MGQMVQELKERGHRLTPQRQLILEAIESSQGHVSAESVHAKVAAQFPQVNISTVYRTLELLEELGLVQHTHLGHGPPTYSVSTDDDHVHLVCRDCGAVQEAPPDVVAPVVEALAATRGFTVDVGHLAVFGRCESCSAQS